MSSCTLDMQAYLTVKVFHTYIGQNSLLYQFFIQQPHILFQFRLFLLSCGQFQLQCSLSVEGTLILSPFFPNLYPASSHVQEGGIQYTTPHTTVVALLPNTIDCYA